MKNLMKRLRELNINNSEDDRVIRQVMEIQIIKFNAIMRGVITQNDSIYKTIDKVIEGFMWLYDNGFTMAKSLEGTLSNNDNKYYEEFCNNFSRFNEFMQSNMDLKE